MVRASRHPGQPNRLDAYRDAAIGTPLEPAVNA